MEQPVIVQPTSTTVRKLTDAFDEVIRGIKALGENAEKRDHWLIYIALTKVDSETRTLWAQETVGEKPPTFESLLKFLNKRTDTLETEKGFSQKIQTARTPKLRAFTTTTFPECSICNQGEHLIHQCEKFKNMTAEQRSMTIKSMSRCFNCLSRNHRVYDCKSKGRCQQCHRKHHSMLHESVVNQSNQEDTTSKTNEVESKVQDESKTTCTKTSVNTITTILPTAMINIRNRHGNFYPFKALLDSASQSSFISESCLQKLELERHNGRVLIKGMGETTIGQTRGITELWIAPTKQLDPIWKTEAFIVSKIAAKQTNDSSIHDAKIPFDDMSLADPTFNKASTIDVLLGVDIFAKAIHGQTRELSSGLIVLNTVFGWVLAGTSNNTNSPETSNFNILVDIDRSLRKFWEVEEIPIEYKKPTEEEEACEILYTITTTKGADNKFSVRLPFRKLQDKIGSSFYLAMNRLQSVERKFQRNPDFKDMYTKFIREYIQLGQMTRICGPVSKDVYYLPHHGVLRESSSTTKLRVVFDGSAKSTSGLSLNDVLMVGPTIQDSLIKILIRFRQHKYAFTGDIEKMYRQVWVSEEDRSQQNILWRNDPSEPLQRFQLNTLTYGTASAPFLAIRSLQEVGIRHLQTAPTASKVIMRDFYVDDLMSGANTDEELSELIMSAINILSSHGFNLRKLLSNSQSIQSQIENKDIHAVKLIFNDPISVKVLGMSWVPSDDIFKFSCTFDKQKVISKRTLLSEAGKIFDPLGWISPLIIRIKILFQDLWLQDLSWDDELPAHVLHSWAAIREDLQQINTLTIPRWLGTTQQVSLHGFSDASEKAYAAVVYAVSAHNNTANRPILIAAKTKVSPLKQQSLPRLELMGALLLSKLVKTVESSLEVTVNQKVLWTDSKIVLDWLSTQPRRWSTFIANRTSQILDDHPNGIWKHVPSEHNPADIASRGISLSDLTKNNLWWNGPDWLDNEIEWPKQRQPKQRENLTTTEMRPMVISMQTTLNKSWFDEFIERYSSYHKLSKILAIILRYVNNLKSKQRKLGMISRCELSLAEQKRAIARELHQLYQYAGIGFLITNIRRKFWILGVKQLAKSTVYNCIACFKERPKPASQMMGNLPEARVQYSHPFDKVGVDYCGPFRIHTTRRRGQIP